MKARDLLTPRQLAPRTRLSHGSLKHTPIHRLDVNHGTQHRSEMGPYLAQLGYSPGNLDSIRYVTRQPEQRLGRPEPGLQRAEPVR